MNGCMSFIAEALDFSAEVFVLALMRAPARDCSHSPSWPSMFAFGVGFPLAKWA